MLQRPQAPRPADGPRARVGGEHAARRRRFPRSRGSSRSPTDASLAAGATPPTSPSRGSRSGWRSSPRCSTSRPAAGRADPARGAALAGDRGRRAPRHHGRVGQQRAAAGPRHARGAQRRRATRRHRSTTRSRRSSPRYVDAFERYDMESLTSLLTRTPPSRCHRSSCGSAAATRSLAFWQGQGAGCRGSGCTDHSCERLARVRAVQAERSRRCLQPWVHLTAGHNALRGSGPDQQLAFKNAMAHVGCPDRRIDRLCITCCSPSQPSRRASCPARSFIAQARRVPCIARPLPSWPRPFGRSYWRAR